jgi:hypothetical protein
MPGFPVNWGLQNGILLIWQIGFIKRMPGPVRVVIDSQLLNNEGLRDNLAGPQRNPEMQAGIAVRQPAMRRCQMRKMDPVCDLKAWPHLRNNPQHRGSNG